MKAGHVYVMDGPNDTVKVGRSTNPTRRMFDGDLRGVRSIVYQTEWTVDANAIERLAHKLLIHEQKGLGGEWFAISADEAIAAIERAKRIVAGVEPMPALNLPKRKLSQEPRPKQVNFRTSEAVYRALERAARKDGRKITNYVEHQIRLALRAEGHL